MSPSHPTDRGEPRAAHRLHAEAVVINMLDGTVLPRHIPGFPLGRFAARLRRAGVSAFLTTVAAHHQDGPLEALRRLGHWHRALAGGERGLILARRAADVARAKSRGQVAVIFGFQDTRPLDEDSSLLETFAREGLRVLQLTYQRRNLAGDGCGEPADAGLSQFGREIIAAANQAGVVVDLSHGGRRTSLEAAEASRLPVIVSHTGARAVYRHVRNIDDELAQAVAAKGGVIGVYAISQFLKPHGASRGTTVDDLIDHIDHFVKVAGIDHVGLGLDTGTFLDANEFAVRRRAWDRLGEEFPELFVPGYKFEERYTRGLERIEGLRRVTARLLRRGYAPDEVRKVLGQNFFRVFRRVWR